MHRRVSRRAVPAIQWAAQFAIAGALGAAPGALAQHEPDQPAGAEPAHVAPAAPAAPAPVAPILELRAHTGAVSAAAFTVDGRMLATLGADGKVKLWKLPGGEGAGEFAAVGTAGASPAFTVDCTSIVYLETPGRLRMRPVAAGEGTAWEWKHGGTIAAFDVPPDSRTVCACGGPTVVVWDRATGEEIGARRPHGDAAIGALACSPDGNLLGTASNGGQLLVTEVRGGRTVFETKLPVGATALLWSPIGKTILARGPDRVLRSIDMLHAGLFPLADLPDASSPFAYSPLGTEIIAAWDAGKVQTWARTRGVWRPVPLSGQTVRVTALRYSWDGRFICTGDADGVVRLWPSAAENPGTVGSPGG